MAGIKISALPAAASAVGTDVIPADQSGPITRKISLSQIATLFNIKSGSLLYNSVSGTTQTAVAGNAYILNNTAATTITLPITASLTIGDTIKIKGRSLAPFIIQANTGQIITMGAASSSTAGTATSSLGSDSIQLVYVSANEWSIDWALSAGINLA